MSVRNVLLVLAHQDDEIALATRILFERRCGAAVHCAYLTDGSAQGRPEQRDRESRIVLTRLGVVESDIHFLGSTFGLRDGHLAEQLDDALDRLRSTFRSMEFHSVYTLAWEGGHHDHDAAHLVALAFAAERGLLHDTWSAPLYNGYRRPGQLFRVMAPLPGGLWEHRPIARSDAGLIIRLTFRYATQRRTWRALLPGLFVRLLLVARESLQRADVARVRRPPHAGVLYYERRFRVPQRRFHELTSAFVERLRL